MTKGGLDIRGITAAAAEVTEGTPSDGGQFEHFVQSRSHALLRTAYLLTGDRHLAEDLLQDTLARVAERWPATAREAYTRKVLYHRAVDTWRARRRRPRAVLVLRFYEDRTETETAAVLDCSVSTVKTTARAALQRLAVCAGRRPRGGPSTP